MKTVPSVGLFGQLLLLVMLLPSLEGYVSTCIIWQRTDDDDNPLFVVQPNPPLTYDIHINKSGLSGRLNFP